MIPLFFSFFCFHTEVCAFLPLIGRGSSGKRGGGVLLVQVPCGVGDTCSHGASSQ